MDIPPGRLIGGGGNGSLSGSFRSESDLESEKINYRITQSVFLGARFIFECGAKLEATPITIATALNMFHTFFKEVQLKQYDVYLIGATSLYLAGKVENQYIKIRDVINVAYTTIHRDSSPPDFGGVYVPFKDSIFQAELLMMRVLQFKITFDHPHKYLTHYLKSIEDWTGFEETYKNPVARTAWAILQDFHHDPAIIEYPPETLAIAAIQLSMTLYNVRVPVCTELGKNSWPKIMYPALDRDMQMEIQDKMLKLYENEGDHLRSAKRESVNGK